MNVNMDMDMDMDMDKNQSTLNNIQWNMNYELWTMNYRYELWALKYEPSVMNFNTNTSTSTSTNMDTDTGKLNKNDKNYCRKGSDLKNKNMRWSFKRSQG